MSSTDSVRQSRRPRGWWLVGAICLVIVVHVGLGFALFRLAGSDMATRGQFGDMFGVVNTLFTGLAFAGLIYTILLQRADLEMQANELVETRNEMKRSTAAQVGSQRAHTEQVKLLQDSARLNVIAALTENYTRQMSTAESLIPVAEIERHFLPYRSAPEDAQPDHEEQLRILLDTFHLDSEGAAHYFGWLNARERRGKLLEMLDEAFEELEGTRQRSPEPDDEL